MTKKLFFLSLLVLATFKSVGQETKFGLTAGYLMIDVTAEYEGVNASVNESGFYIGALADIPLSTSFHLTPGVNYGSIEDSGLLQIPVMAKYYFAASGFHLQAGPQASIILEETGDDTNAFGLDLGFGAGFDINEHFFIEARYALELTNRLTDDFTQEFGDISSKINSLNIGVGYKF